MSETGVVDTGVLVGALIGRAGLARTAPEECHYLKECEELRQSTETMGDVPQDALGGRA